MTPAGDESTLSIFDVSKVAEAIELDFVYPVPIVKRFLPARQAHRIESWECQAGSNKALARSAYTGFRAEP